MFVRLRARARLALVLPLVFVAACGRIIPESHLPPQLPPHRAPAPVATPAPAPATAPTPAPPANALAAGVTRGAAISSLGLTPAAAGPALVGFREEITYRGLALGIFGAIVLVYLLLVVNFQSWLDPLIIITALPGALVGIVWTLLITHTHLSVPALTGAIMCMGVATANSVLVVSFARELLQGGTSAVEAAIEAGYTRIRPVIMTAIAMLVGMLPLALGLGEGGEQNAPLGRAVIGGLVFATAATLLVVPCMFALMHARTSIRPAPAMPEVLHV